MFCPRCGTQSPDERNFCNRCGTSLRLVTDALAGRSNTATPVVLQDSRASERRAELEIAKRELIKGAVYVIVAQGVNMVTGRSFWGLVWIFTIIGILKLVKHLADYAGAYWTEPAAPPPRQVDTNPLEEPAAARLELHDAAAGAAVLPPASVVEHTTKRLADHAPPGGAAR